MGIGSASSKRPGLRTNQEALFHLVEVLAKAKRGRLMRLMGLG
jgi:hypothetical protein